MFYIKLIISIVLIVVHYLFLNWTKHYIQLNVFDSYIRIKMLTEFTYNCFVFIYLFIIYYFQGKT